VKYNRYSILTLFGHICTDINQGALPALLPFLVLYKGVSYTAAAGLVFASNSMSSFIQPFFGYLGDKVSWPWLMGAGAFLAGAGLALVGFLDNYWAIFGAVCVCGIGVALFHPEGGRMANLAAGEKKGAGIALFAIGGSLGFVLGPAMASIALTVMGLRGTIVFLLPAVGMVIVTMVSLKGLNRISREAQHKKIAQRHVLGKDDWKSFATVAGCMTGRSVLLFGLTTFIPLYFAGVFRLSATEASNTLVLYAVMSAVCTLLGGHAADRFGFHRVIRFCFLLLVPFVCLFPLVGSVALAIAFLAPIAIGVNGPQAAIVTLGQKFLPNHLGTASGILFGLSVSMGGMVAPGIGWIGDHHGLAAALYVVAGFAVLTAGLAFLIPARK